MTGWLLVLGHDLEGRLIEPDNGSRSMTGWDENWSEMGVIHDEVAEGSFRTIEYYYLVRQT